MAAFVSEGTGPSAKAWHRTVVAFVVVMLGGLLVHAGAVLDRGVVGGAHAHGHAGHEEPPALVLDDGKRWSADAHTTRSVRDLRDLVVRAQAKDSHSPAAWSDRTAAMDEAFANVFRGCRMEGSAHEQLHAFLLPLAPELHALGDMAPADAHLQLERIQRHLERYETYFE